MAIKLTTKEVAAQLGIGVSTLCKLRIAGGGPVFMKLGARRVVYDLADVEAWAAESRRASTSANAPPGSPQGAAK